MGVKVDGMFGRSTEIAVIAYQKSHGLGADGIVGPTTWASLTGTPATGAITTARDEPSAPASDTHSIPEYVASFGTTYRTGNSALRDDAVRARRYASEIGHVCAEFNLVPNLIVGFGSRESRWGDALSPRGPAGKGDHGHGRGLLQIDDRFHEFARTGRWADPYSNIHYGVGVLISYYEEIDHKSHLEGASLIRAAIAAYNCGVGNVLTAIKHGADLDHFTTGRNYSIDVLARANWFRLNDWETPQD